MSVSAWTLVLQDRATSDEPLRLLACRDGEPVGWLSVDRRERFEAFEFARVDSSVGDPPDGMETCFSVREDARGGGLIKALLRAAQVHVRDRGGAAVE